MVAEDPLVAPRWLFTISKPRALLVVAHPDDETIFSGGLILSSAGTRWTIVCCIPENAQRRREFLKACQLLAVKSGSHVEPVVLELAPGARGLIDREKLAERLESYTTGFDIVFTHNREGEYGHPNHKIVHRVVMQTIAHPNTWVFVSPGSRNVNQDGLRSRIPEGTISLELSPEIQQFKIEIFHECHRSQARLFGYDKTGQLQDSDLRETLLWEFESGREEYTLCR